jgi:lipoprotein-releasing system permease protein
MHPNADIFLALRYLKPKRTFISVITLLSILGPILGVGLLIIVISVMSGFDHELKTGILGMQSHIQVYPGFSATPGTAGVIRDPNPILRKLEQLDCQGAPIIEGPILIQVRNQTEGKYLRGIIPKAESQVTSLKQNVTGRYEIEEGEVLIGAQLAAQMGLGIGDQFLIHSPTKLTRNFRWKQDGSLEVGRDQSVYLPEEVTVAGIFSMGVYEFDSSVVFMQLDQAADLFGLEWGSATSVHAKTPDPFKLNAIDSELKEAFPFYRLITWQEANKRMFDALRVEKNLMFFLLTFIVIVAAFGIAGTLITVVVQKTREIGILKAVGMPNGTVARIFLFQGALIGLIGTTLGTGVGLLVIRFREQIAGIISSVMGVEIFPAELYHFNKIPALVEAGDVAVIASSAFVICLLASLIPAMYASLLAPATALREDG